MIRYKIGIVFILMVFSSCSVNRYVKESSAVDDLIELSVSDFVNNCRLFRKGRVFDLDVNKVDNEYTMIGIRENSMKVPVSKNQKLGLQSDIPSRYIEHNNRLIFWRDETYALTQKALDILQKYNVLQDYEEGTIVLPETYIETSGKAAHYYYCENDYLKNERVLTNIGFGYYSPPDLNCLVLKE